MPADLIRDPRTTPFNIGQRIELADFTFSNALALSRKLGADPETGRRLLERIFYWTNGHPYLTQRFCRAAAESTEAKSPEFIDCLCDGLFLSSRAREQDDNLLFVRERILRTEADLAKLLGIYEQVLQGELVKDDDSNDLINQLRLAGIVSVVDGHLRVRNRIYEQVFDRAWIQNNRPDAELEKADGQRVRIQSSCSLGRASTNDVVLPDQKVSRRHALVQAQKQHEFWLMDLGSSNGTFLNGRRVTQPILLRDRDRIEVGPFQLIFRQAKTVAASDPHDQTNADQTLFGAKTLFPQ